MYYVKSYQEKFKEKNPDIPSKYFEWDQKDEVIAYLKNQPVENRLVVGHSYGGSTGVAGVATEIPLSILITIDPVGWFDTPKDLTGKVNLWLNANAQPKEGNFTDFVAMLGGKWGTDTAKFANGSYNVDTNHGNFATMMNTNVPGTDVSPYQLLTTFGQNSAAGGFVIYPNKQNLNQLRSFARYMSSKQQAELFGYFLNISQTPETGQPHDQRIVISVHQ